MALKAQCHISEVDHPPHPKQCQKLPGRLVPLPPSDPSSHHTNERRAQKLQLKMETVCNAYLSWEVKDSLVSLISGGIDGNGDAPEHSLQTEVWHL